MALAELKPVLLGPHSNRRLIFAGVGAAMLAVLFWDALVNLWMRWGELQELSHSYFIPLISIWLVWTNREAVAKSVGDPSIAGPILLAVSGVLLIIGKLTFIYLFQHIGIVVAIAGLTAAFGGLSLLRTTAAPILFLFFAVPPPYWVITVLSWRFQEMSSVIGVGMIEAMGIPVLLTGNIIDLGDYKLQVAEACSGLRYLFPFLSLGVMAAYLYRGPLLHKAIIVLATVPITILMNSFRIAVTGALVQAYGTSHAEGALHFFEGWVVFVLCLIALFGVIWALCFFSRPRRNPLLVLGAPDLKPAPATRSAAPIRALILSAVAIAVAGLASTQLSTDSLIIPERARFANLPDEFPDWRVDVRPMAPEVAEVLAADDTIVADMESPAGESYNLYIAYLDAQRDGRSWHSPRQCIPGGGWQIVRHTVERATAPDGSAIHYNRLVIQFREHRQLVYYWYHQRGRKIANEFVMKLWLIVDAVTRKRSDGAMVRLIAPLRPGDDEAAVEARLKAMQAKIDTILPAYVPD